MKKKKLFDKRMNKMNEKKSLVIILITNEKGYRLTSKVFNIDCY